MKPFTATLIARSLKKFLEVELDPKTTTRQIPQDLIKYMKLLEELDPTWYQNLLENHKPVWYDLFNDPKTLSEEDPRTFLKISGMYLWALNEEILVLWNELNSGSLEEALKANPPFQSPEIATYWGETYPQSFKEACRKDPRRALNSCYDRWKELDEQQLTEALLAHPLRENWTDGLIEAALRDHPEKLTGMLSEQVNGETTPGPTLYSSMTTPTDVGRTVPRLMREIWADLNPGGYLTLCERNPQYFLGQDPDLWAKVNEESYLKVCARYPGQMATNGEILFQVDPELFKQIIENELQKPGLGSIVVQNLEKSKLLLDWDKYKNEVNVDRLIAVGKKCALEEFLPEVLTFLKGSYGWTLTEEAVHELIDNSLTMGKETYRKVITTLSENNFGEYLSEQNLQTLKDLDPETWAINGQIILEHQALLLRKNQSDSTPRRLVLLKVTSLLNYFKANKETLASWLGEATSENVDDWLELAPMLLEDAQRESLTYHILENPGQTEAKIAWASSQAANLTAHSKPVKLRKNKQPQEVTKGVSR